MIRRSQLLLWTVTLLLAGAISAAYTGMAEFVVSPSQLPGSPVVGGAAIFGLLVVAFLLGDYLDVRSWKQTGRALGLSSNENSPFASPPPKGGSSGLFGEPALTGTINGRPVRAWTESVGGGRNSSSTTYTVLETQLDTPVEWMARLTTDGIEEPTEDHGIDAANVQHVDGLTLQGDVPQDVATAIAAERIEDTLASLEGQVAVGHVKDAIVDDMLDSLPEESQSMAASFAEGMLEQASAGDEGPSRTVQHREAGLLLDAAEFDRRFNAITTIAGAVDRSSSTTR